MAHPQSWCAACVNIGISECGGKRVDLDGTVMKDHRFAVIILVLFVVVAGLENAYTNPRASDSDNAVRSSFPPRAETAADTSQPPAKPQAEAKQVRARVPWAHFVHQSPRCRYLARSEMLTILSEAVAKYGVGGVSGPQVPFSAAASNSTSSTRAPSAPGRCEVVTRKGKQCNRTAQPGSQYCWHHRR
jgi:hypothetical protein